MSISSWRKYVADQPQCNFKVTKQPLTATFIHPGLNYTNIDRFGMIDIWSLLSYVFEIQNFPQYYPYTNQEEQFFSWGGARHDRSIFLSSIQLVLSRNMYNREVPKWPLEVKSILRYVGNSSVSLQIESYVPGSQDPLLTYTLQMVGVDTQTHKPKPSPDWFKDKYKDQCLMNTGFQLKTFQRPQNTSVHSREVQWLDTDANNHTNFASYVRFALDGLYRALKNETEVASDTKSHHHPSSDSGITNHLPNNPSSSPNLVSTSEVISGRSLSLPATANPTKNRSSGLRGITMDVLRGGVKSLKVCYANEAIEGDVIDVHVWQEENEALLVRCSIEKGPDIVCQVILEYFGPVAKL